MAITDKFASVISGTTRPVATTLSAQKLSGATTATVVSTTGWDTATALHGIMYNTDASGNKVQGSQIDWKATVSGTTLSNFTVTAGSDTTYNVGATVELAPTAAWADDLVAGILTSLDQDGTLKSGAVDNAAVLASNVVTTAKILDSNVTTAKIADNNVTAAKLATSAITLGYSQLTANATTTNTTPTSISLSAAVTIPAGGRRVKITAYCGTAYNTTAGKRVELSIWDGTVGSGTRLGLGTAVAGGGTFESSSCVAMAVHTPSAGAKTYNVGLAANDTGTATLEASATSPIFLLVETI